MTSSTPITLSSRRGGFRLGKHQESTGGHTTHDRQGGGCPATKSERRDGRTGIRELRGEGGGWVRGTGHSNRGRVSYRTRLGSLIRRHCVDDGELGRDSVGGTVGVVHEGHVIIIAGWNVVEVDV